MKKNSTFLKTTIEITGIPQNSAEFAGAEAMGRDGRIKKQYIIKDYHWIFRNHAEFREIRGCEVSWRN